MFFAPRKVVALTCITISWRAQSGFGHVVVQGFDVSHPEGPAFEGIEDNVTMSLEEAGGGVELGLAKTKSLQVGCIAPIHI